MKQDGTVAVEFQNLDTGNSYLYYHMSKIPRIGDTVILQDQDNLEGVVVNVVWLLDHDGDGSDCVGVYFQSAQK